VLLEAMACGTAIVATRVQGASALDGAGILVAADDPQGIADAADSLLADPDRRRLLGCAARARAVDQYPIQRSLDGTLRLWRELGALPAGDRPRTGTQNQSPAPGKEAG
jgi:glycosyltransferase involved in cell wall biosynthesis